MKSIFGGKKPDPKEQAKQWRLTLKSEMRKLAAQVVKIDREEKKIIAEIKKAAKEGQPDGAKILAKEVIRTRKTKERILVSKANMNSMEMQLANQMATMRVAGAMGKSAELMAVMNTLIKDKECFQVMRDLAQEMEKANIIDEIVQDTFEDMEPDGLEEESNDEIERILAEVMGAQLDKMHSAPMQAPAGRKQAAAEEEEAASAESDEESMEDMQARIAALRA